jgi:predicted transcriptional regulator
MAVISDILTVAMDSGRGGTIISAITRRANLSHSVALKKCQKLIDLGFMESIKNKKNQVFIITEKGILIFHQLQRFIDFVKSFKIRY